MNSRGNSSQSTLKDESFYQANFQILCRHVAASSSLETLSHTPPLEADEHAPRAPRRRGHDVVWEDGVRTYVSISLCTTPAVSEYETEFANEIKEAYYALIEMGGRPTREIELDPGSPDPVETQRHLRHYASFWAAQLTFKEELVRWKKFRDHQQEAREKSEEFLAYCQSVCDYRRENGMEGEIHLKLQWDQQTKLDEWKEYQFFQHRELAGPRARILRRIQRAQEQVDKGRWSEGDAQSEIRSENLALKELDDLWEWVEHQLSQIASDPSISGPDQKDNHTPHQCQIPSSAPGQITSGSAAQLSATRSGSREGDRLISPRRSERISNFSKRTASLGSTCLGPHASKVSKPIQRKAAQFREGYKSISPSPPKGCAITQGSERRCRMAQRPAPRASTVQRQLQHGGPRRSERIAKRKRLSSDLAVVEPRVEATNSNTFFRSQAKGCIPGKADPAGLTRPSGISKKRIPKPRSSKKRRKQTTS